MDIETLAPERAIVVAGIDGELLERMRTSLEVLGPLRVAKDASSVIRACTGSPTPRLLLVDTTELADAFDLVRAVRFRRRHISVIVLVKRGDSFGKVNAINAGARAMVEKPVELGALQRALERVFRGSDRPPAFGRARRVASRFPPPVQGARKRDGG